ncbi:hypothetical protein [Kitasatospora sp. NPDC059673]|uniref:hypothetical protein n=1 Tax=Kitasatospora sp. NPDC059673 TaxID=3346901 RepID=UPI0036B86D82
MNGSVSEAVEVEWEPGRGRLRVRVGGPRVRPGTDQPSPAEFVAPVVLVLSEDSTPLDVEVRGLPAEAVRRLSPYSAVRHRAPASDVVSLDYEAGWLWVRLAEGTAARRLHATATVRLAPGERFGGIDLDLRPGTATAN